MLIGPSKPVSNRATYNETWFVKDTDINELVDLTGRAIQVEIASNGQAPPGTGGTLLRASTDDGSVMVVGLGTFNVIFSAAQMRGLAAGNYEMGITTTFDDETTQLAAGLLRVSDGIVRTVQ